MEVGWHSYNSRVVTARPIRWRWNSSRKYKQQIIYSPDQHTHLHIYCDGQMVCVKTQMHFSRERVPHTDLKGCRYSIDSDCPISCKDSLKPNAWGVHVQTAKPDWCQRVEGCGGTKSLSKQKNWAKKIAVNMWAVSTREGKHYSIYQTHRKLSHNWRLPTYSAAAVECPTVACNKRGRDAGASNVKFSILGQCHIRSMRSPAPPPFCYVQLGDRKCPLPIGLAACHHVTFSCWSEIGLNLSLSLVSRQVRPGDWRDWESSVPRRTRQRSATK